MITIASILTGVWCCYWFSKDNDFNGSPFLYGLIFFVGSLFAVFVWAVIIFYLIGSILKFLFKGCRGYGKN